LAFFEVFPKKSPVFLKSHFSGFGVFIMLR